MASSEAPSKVKVVIETVERIGIEFEQLEKCSVEVRNDIQKAMHETDKSIDTQRIINTISHLDKSLAYLRFIKHVETIR